MILVAQFFGKTMSVKIFFQMSKGLAKAIKCHKGTLNRINRKKGCDVAEEYKDND